MVKISFEADACGMRYTKARILCYDNIILKLYMLVILWNIFKNEELQEIREKWEEKKAKWFTGIIDITGRSNVSILNLIKYIEICQRKYT